MTVYKIEPQDVKTTQSFKCVRPFKIFENGNESNVYIFELDLAKVSSENIDTQSEELERFASELSQIVGKEIKKDQLTKIIQDRELTI